MPAIREHELHPSNTDDNMDDDDGMPPLVDNPNPSMTFTFFTDMTPITALSADPTVPFETVWENPVSPAELASPVDGAELYERGAFHPDRASHAKKRDASYIPRPPNAFILFRSSFIRSQQVPEKVEGNHSTLSKIIGKYWKTLPREEREVWEAKALVAQAEHRKRYPDWRFRPGANTFAKLKIKDGPQPANRKRAGQGGRKVKGDPASKKTKSGDERCAVIADLLVEGKTGVDLEDAVRQWEDSVGRETVGGNDAYSDGTGFGTKNEDGDEHREGGAVANNVDPHGNVVSTLGDQVLDTNGSLGAVQMYRYGGYTRAQTPDAVHDDRFRIPLTAMFKRSLSAPASHPSPTSIPRQRQDSLDSVFANVSYDMELPQGVCSPTFGGDHTEELAHAVSPEMIGSLSPLVLPSVLREGVPARWNDPYNLLETSLGLPAPECTELTYALHTPASLSPDGSPVEHPSYTFCSPGAGGFDVGLALSTAYMHEPKSWAECTLGAHTQMPVFVNACAGGDWCGCPHMYGANADAAYGYPCGGVCLPAVAY